LSADSPMLAADAEVDPCVACRPRSTARLISALTRGRSFRRDCSRSVRHRGKPTSKGCIAGFVKGSDPTRTGGRLDHNEDQDPGVARGANDLHVLLRHRSLSISRRSVRARTAEAAALLRQPGSFEGFAATGLERDLPARTREVHLVDLPDLWLAGVDPNLLEEGHELRAKRLEGLA
jgi:hypothetical protein